MLEIELLGAGYAGPQVPSEASVGRLCALAAAVADVHDGHLAIEFVPEARIVALNGEHRGRAAPTDVLSFPIDGPEDSPDGVPRELGDVVICAAHTEDIPTAIVHGVLHLVGLDHECDDGEMLALQAEIMRWEQL